MIQIDLPRPPSVNALWRYFRGHVYRTKRYRQWIKQADALYMCLPREDRKRIRGSYVATILISGARGDIDNYIKASLDWLQNIGVTDNDKNCQSVFAKRVLKRYAPMGMRIILDKPPE